LKNSKYFEISRTTISKFAATSVQLPDSTPFEKYRASAFSKIIRTFLNSTSPDFRVGSKFVGVKLLKKSKNQKTEEMDIG
jgi:hypothetical protein